MYVELWDGCAVTDEYKIAAMWLDPTGADLSGLRRNVNWYLLYRGFQGSLAVPIEFSDQIDIFSATIGLELLGDAFIQMRRHLDGSQN